jgi:FlaA1/EpsC-like NDP-sugar epimerase
MQHSRRGNGHKGTRLLIVGAGQAADLVLRDIVANGHSQHEVVGLVDDDRRLTGMTLHQRRVLGTVDDIGRLVREQDVEEILIAAPSATPDQLKRILRLSRPTGLPVKTLPSLKDLVEGKVSVRDARELRIEDLLGRPLADIDLGAIRGYLYEKRVMITGASGSIGSELARQVVALGPSDLILVDNDESGLYYLHEELRKMGARRYLIRPTSVTLNGKMERVFEETRPQVVFHAAAYKHVPLMELNPDEAVVTNIKGTYVVGDLAGRFGAERVINISTDKAVAPVNVMGATKRAGELVTSFLGRRYPQTHYTSVRFGNVLGSQGSVIPIFQRQIEGGGPVTITHPEMTRYFMMISEAVQLVLQAAALQDEISVPHLGPGRLLPETSNGHARNGNARETAISGQPVCVTGHCQGVFVLEMGRPMRIIDLARQMIDLLADPSEEVPLRVTGVRPGEKLHEELFTSDEAAVRTSHPLIYFAHTTAEKVNHAREDGSAGLGTDFQGKLERLIRLAEEGADPSSIIAALQDLIPAYHPFDLQSGAPNSPGLTDSAFPRTRQA